MTLNQILRHLRLVLLQCQSLQRQPDCVPPLQASVWSPLELVPDFPPDTPALILVVLEAVMMELVGAVLPQAVTSDGWAQVVGWMMHLCLLCSH